jgi:hypothetical protein
VPPRIDLLIAALILLPASPSRFVDSYTSRGNEKDARPCKNLTGVEKRVPYQPCRVDISIFRRFTNALITVRTMRDAEFGSRSSAA